MDEASLAAGITIGATIIFASYLILHHLSPLNVIIDPFFRPRDKVRVISKTPTPEYPPEEFINEFVESCERHQDNEGCVGFHMGREDWKPLIDAMEHLSNLPQCGDVAKHLLYIFKAARAGKYYFIEMGYEGQDARCYIISQEFTVDQTREKTEN